MNTSADQQNSSIQCPLISNGSEEVIMLKHGEGARATRKLITDRILTRFGNEHLNQLSDATHLNVSSDRIAFSTDSYVVSPLTFPGGDIGSMSVYGTVNDLSVSGAIPKWISLGLIVEEGLPFSVLDRVLDSISAAAKRCQVHVVAGDTKVVPRGKADGIFINTTGIGEVHKNSPVGPSSISNGDSIIVSGPIGRHGIAVLSAREELNFTPSPISDSGPLHEPILSILSQGDHGIRAMRDATRGGVTSVLHEWSQSCGLTMQVEDASLPIDDAVRGASELLGLDPLYIANEGTMILAVDPEKEVQILSVLHSHPETQNAVTIGNVKQSITASVTILRLFGKEQPLDEPAGALLPRIC